MHETLYKKSCYFARDLSEFLLDLPTIHVKNEPVLVNLEKLINFQKGATLVFCLMCLFIRRQEPPSVYNWIYTGLHGGYGVIWVIKSMAFPDKRFQIRVPLVSAIVVSVVLTAYWYIAWLALRSPPSRLDSSDPERAFWAVLISVIGIFTTFGADIQKSIELKHKQGLITTGFFKYTRNPNYLGEMMIYLGFAILSK